ncbi:MAG: RDD family protein [Terriglobales bacterium]
MPCPLCGDNCTCSYVPPRASGRKGASDARVKVPSEPVSPQVFATSSPPNEAIGTSSERNLDSFVVHSELFEATEEQFIASLSKPLREPEFQMDSNHRARVRYTPAESAPEGAAKSGDISNELPSSRARSGIEREFAEREQLESSLEQQSQYWREEVASRVNSYRTRRSRKRLAGEFSMKLNFDTPTGIRAAAAQVAQEWPQSVADVEPTPAMSKPPAIPAHPFQDAPELLEDENPEPPTAKIAEAPKIIEFPRPDPPPQPSQRREPSWELLFPLGDELAEPVLDRLRIVEAPEAIEVPAPAPISDIELGESAEEEELGSPDPAFDLPLQVASLPQRFTAALLDWLVVLIATAGFAMIVMKTAAGIPHSRVALAFALLVPIIFWAAYQYLFLVHAGRTPGMQMTNLVLSTFGGIPARRQIRRWRALVLVLSFVSLGLGFLWALFDEDTLCWHDKVTRTYLTPRR